MFGLLRGCGQRGGCGGVSLTGSLGLDGESMDALAGQVAQCLVDHALAAEARLAGKGGASISTVKCDLPVPSSPMWPDVAGTVVDDSEMGGRGLA